MDLTKQAQTLRRGNPDDYRWQKDLKKFMVEREVHLSRCERLNVMVGDAISISPLDPKNAWKEQ